MSLVCIASQEGSPGATTTSLLLTGLWPKSQKRKVYLEADPNGGSLAATYHLSLNPDLATLAEAVDSGIAPKRLWRHTQLLPGSTEAVVSPPKSDDVYRVLETGGPKLGQWLNQLDEIDVFADVGCLDIASPAQRLVSSASSVLMVARPVSDQLRLGAERMRELQDSVEQVSWVLIGDAPYSAKEVEIAYGFPVMAVLADDSQTALSLEQGSSVSRLAQAPLVQTARKLVEVLQIELAAPIDTPSSQEPGSAAGFNTTQKPEDGQAGLTPDSHPQATNRTPFPTKPAPMPLPDDDATIAAPGLGLVDPSLVPPSLVGSSSGPSTVDPSVVSGPGVVDPSLVPPSLVGSSSGPNTVDPSVVSGPGTFDPSLVPPSLAAIPDTSDDAEAPKSSPFGDQLTISGDVDLVDQDEIPVDSTPQKISGIADLDIETHAKETGPVDVESDNGTIDPSFQKTMEPIPGREFWDVTTRLSAPPVPLRFSVAQERVPVVSSKPPTKPPPPVVPPSKKTNGTEEKDRPTVTDLTAVSSPIEVVPANPIGGRDMEITEVIQSVGTPTGKNDVPPSLLSPPDASEKTGIDEPEPSSDGRPPSLLDAKLSTSANPADKLPGYPPID